MRKKIIGILLILILIVIFIFYYSAKPSKINETNIQENKSQETLAVSNIMTPKEKLVTATEKESSDVIKDLLYKNRIEKILLVDKNFSLKGLVTLKDINKTKDFPLATKDGEGR